MWRDMWARVSGENTTIVIITLSMSSGLKEEMPSQRIRSEHLPAIMPDGEVFCRR